MCRCMHTRTHTQAHMTTHTHARAHTSTHTRTHRHTHTHMHTRAHTRTHRHTHSHTRTPTHPCTRAHTHTCAHTHAHTCAHTHAHTHAFITGIQYEERKTSGKKLHMKRGRILGIPHSGSGNCLYARHSGILRLWSTPSPKVGKAFSLNSLYWKDKAGIWKVILFYIKEEKTWGQEGSKTAFLIQRIP